MLKTILRPLAAGMALALLASLTLGTAPAAAEGDEKKIRIKKVHRVCDGEDCEHEHEGGKHHSIFIGEGGEMHEIHKMMGDEVTWVEAGDHGVHVLGGSGTFLGVQLTELSRELRAHFGAPESQGVMVSKVIDGSPAALAGVEVGDVITAVDGEAVRGAAALGRLIRERDEGETISLEVYRAGRIETLSPTLARREGLMEARRLHGAHEGLHGMHKVMVRCDEEDGEKDCEVTMGDVEAISMGDFDCGDADECVVQVECGDSGCECTANGEAVDCDELPSFAERHGG